MNSKAKQKKLAYWFW